MKKRNRAAVLALAGTILASAVMTGCGGGGKSASADETFTWWIYSGADAAYYTDYKENPAVQYTLAKTWGADENKIDLEFWQPPAGKELDNYSTMIAGGDLPDILDAVVCEPPKVMYEKGYAMDITEYVEKYMPNYVKLVHADETILKNTVVNENGKEHYYALSNIYDQEEPVFQGYMYRRDWIVKYGTNPKTGAAFTGGYTDENDPDSWEDDVVFPSGETDPLYISDWEWMFDIFQKAQADLKIEDGYCLSLYYPGFTWSGGLPSCFGGGTCVWYQDKDNKVHFGGNEDGFRTYLECMNSWYEKGWLDQTFNERTSDAFYGIDTTSVRQGKIGMWNGRQSELGGRLDMNDGGFTEGIYVAGASYPINDIYGDDSCKYVEPDCVMGSSLVSGGVVITTAAKDKNLPALFSYLDYFYSEEGALVRNLGLNKDQMEELSDKSFYENYNLTDGCYSVTEDGRYLKAEAITGDGGNLQAASSFEKACGLRLVKNVDLGLAENYQHSLDQWVKYKNTGFFQGQITTNMMSPDDQKFCDDLRSKIIEFETKNAADFIMGKKDISKGSKDWETWSKSLTKYNYQKASDIYQTYVDEYPFH